MSDHHIWCNFWMRGPVEECDMCKRFFELYPYEGLTGHEMVAKYFPGAIPLSPDNGIKLNSNTEGEE